MLAMLVCSCHAADAPPMRHVSAAGIPQDANYIQGQWSEHIFHGRKYVSPLNSMVEVDVFNSMPRVHRYLIDLLFL